ncbi:tape measure protein [Bilophila wadsworthia]|uniref:tape measure protein n=1 Tax=Bilophila wadsworthia TaxID=35833 RepID=UPI0027BA7795|nr:tape measure protein [Bilophila wadsworthia]
MAKKTPGIYIAIRGDYSAFETDLNRAKKMAQAQGDAIAKSIGNAVSKADLTGGINKLTRELKTAQAALSAGAFKGQVSGLEEIAKAAGVSSKQLEGLTNSMLKSQAAATANRAFEYLQKNAGLSTLELAKLRVQLGDTSGAMSTLWSGAKAAAVPVMAIGAAAIYAGKACFDASLQMDRLVKSYTTIEGSTSGAVSQLDYIYEISNKLGLEFQSTAEAAKGFFAAGKGSALQKDLNGIFEGVSQAGAALSLSTEQMDGVFLALGQMISKGKVQAEELRGQLGERLPGAFNLAARAMGVTTAQLDDMLKKGQVTAEDMLPKLAAVLKDEFGPAAEQASQGAQGAVNRLSTEWNLFKATVMDNKGIIAAINAITGALENRNQAMMKAARREAAIKSLEEDGVIKQGEKEVTDVSIASGAVTVQKIKFYTEEQIKARMGLEKAWEAHNKHSKQLQEEETKIIADGSAATKNFLKNSTEGKKAALQEDYNNTLKALNAQIAVYKKQGQDVSGLEQERLKITAEYQRQLESINKKGTKSAETAAKRAAVSGINLDELRKSVEALEAANIPAAKSFDQMAEKIREQSKQTQIAIEADAARMVATKKLTVAQAEEWKGLKFREDAAKTTQKLAEVEAKRAEQDKKYADLRLDFEKRYADMVGLSSEAVSKSISKQAEEYRKAIEAGENAAEELVRLEEWKRDQIQRASREAMDGAQVALRDYQVEASNQAKSMNDAFRGLFSGMDSGWKSAWEQMIETGKVSLSSFRSVFASFLADLMHMAITRPITVQIAGVVSGMLGTGGVAYAAGDSGGGAGGLLGNVPLSNLSSFLPDSFTSGLSGIMGATLPGTVSALTTPGAYTAGEILLMQGGGTTAGTVGGQAALMSGGLSLGSALMYGGLGSLGYSVLGGALGLPQSKYSGLTAGLGGALGAWGGSALGSAAGVAAGSALGSVVPVVGTVLGAIGGGLLGSLFGGGRRTHASVYSRMEDVGFSRDQQTYIDAFMGGAWYDRAGKKEAEPFAQGIAQVASQTAGSLLDIAGALPEQIRQNALSGLETSTWSAGRGISDASWNFQWWKEGMAEEDLEEAAQDMRNQMTAVAQQVFSNAGISQFFDSFDVTTDEGLQKASTALSAISAVKSATDAITSPLSEMEQQAQSAKAQLDTWTQGMKDSGVNAQYAAGLINEYRTAFINDYIKTLDESLHPLSAYAQAVKAANEAVDQRKKALEIIGATESQLAQVEAMRAEVVKQATEEMLRSFDQSVAQRWAAVNGNSDEVGRAISQANELRETIQQFGEGSAQVAELLKLHAAETVKAAQDAAKSEYDSLRAQMDGLEQQRVQLQQQAIQEQINAINEQLSAAKTLKSTWEGLDKSLGQSRYNLFAGSANLNVENRLGVTQAEFRRLSGLALGGDSNAAGQLAGVGTSLLDLVKQTAGTEEEYLDAFWAVNAQLKSAQDAAGAQVSAADKQLEALQGQLDVQNAALEQLQGQSATLEEIEKQIAELRPLLDAAGDKAGVKAFARGGLAMPGWAMVGEEGPELVNFSQPGRVYTAADTAALFRSVTPRAADTDSGSDAEVKALRREVYQLRRDMLISMSEIARFSRRTSDMVEAWDAEGMPGVRA